MLFLVEICILSHHGSSMLDSLIKPPVPIPENITRIHGITNEMVADAPTFPDIYPRLKEVLEDNPVVIYNASFDTGIIDNCCEYYQLPKIEYFPHCAMNIYAEYYGEFSRYWGNYKWQKLPGGGKHRAFWDAKACYELLHAMAKPESCERRSPQRMFPPVQVFCEWHTWLDVEVKELRTWGWYPLHKRRIKKPVFCIKGTGRNDGNELDAESVPF